MLKYLPLIVISALLGTVSTSNSTPFKCCDDEYILDNSFGCTIVRENSTSDGKFFDALFNSTNEAGLTYSVCRKNGSTNVTCVDILANGTQVMLTCDSPLLASNDTVQECFTVFSTMNLWGATTVIFATMIYNIPFILVVIIYCALPALRTRAYDKAVISYNLCYMIINFLLIILGYRTLCNDDQSDITYQLFGLGFMFFVQGSVVWLFIICFDMTLVITRFRWAPKGGADRGREEKRKFLIYAAWGWGVPAFLTLIPLIAEFSQIFPDDSPLKPNFQKSRGANPAVIAYVMTGPVLVCLTNTCLFIYTTVKTIAVQKSTAIINENRKNNVKKKYVLFLKLYLLMDTPWLTSALGAIYPDLWILKFIKMIQPIILLVLIIPRKRMIEAIQCRKVAPDVPEAVRLKEDSRRKDNLPTTKMTNGAKKY